MVDINTWNKYINLVHELALIEDDLRDTAAQYVDEGAAALAERVLFERFGTE